VHVAIDALGEGFGRKAGGGEEEKVGRVENRVARHHIRL
jgi:hypothetical protein